MPNFALVKHVGGQPKPLSAYLQDIDQRRDADSQRQIRDMQIMDAEQKMTDRETLRSVMQRSGGNWEQASQDALAAGASPEAVMSLQDRARGDEDRAHTLESRGQAKKDRTRKEAVDTLAVAGKIDELASQVGDQESYDRYRVGASQIAQEYGIPFNAPEAYDPAYIEAKRRTAQEINKVWRTLTPTEEIKAGLDPDGSYKIAIGGKDKGDIKPITKPAAERKRSVMEYADPNSPTGTRIGYSDGVVGKRGKGSIGSRASKAGGSFGGGPARAQLTQFLVQNKIAPDMNTAWAMSGEAAMNPRKFGLDMAKLELGNMGVDDPAKLQARVEYWTNYAQQTQNEDADDDSPPMPGARKAPDGKPSAAPQGMAQPTGLPPAAASQLKEGSVTTFGNGQQWTLQGGQQVRVK